MKETDLRDMISQNIDKIKPGLILFKKEQYIPSDKYQYVFHDKNSSYNKVTLAKALIFFTLEFELIVVTMVVFMLIPNIF